MTAAIPTIPIGKLIEKVVSWNPPRDAPDDELDYIDLSSVDNATKQITGNQTVIGRDAPSRARQRVKAGDILVSTVRPNLNGIARVPEHLDGATASTGFCVLRPLASKLDASYLFHWVQSTEFVSDMVRKATGASYPAVSDKIIAQSEIPLPHLDEQKRVAAILNQADELRRKRQRAIDRLNQLGQAIFHEMFGDPATNAMGWPQAELSSICEINPRNNSNLVDDEPVSFLPMASVSEDGSISSEQVRTIAEVKKGFTSFQRGDVLLAKITPCFENGKATKTDDLMHRYGFGSTEFHVIRPSRHANSDFLFHIIHRAAFRAEGELNMTGSAGQKRVPASFLKDYVIPLPPFEMQMNFAKRVREIADTKLANASSLGSLNKLFDALQHQAFRGELTHPDKREVAA